MTFATLADTLGSIFFAGTMLGGIGWLMLVAHGMGWITLPQRNK